MKDIEFTPGFKAFLYCLSIIIAALAIYLTTPDLPQAQEKSELSESARLSVVEDN